MYTHIVGNDHIKEYLKRMVEKRAIGNSLLFAGPGGIGKGLFAQEFAKHLICLDDPHGIHRRKIEAGNHPDIRVYRPEGKIAMHSIDSMRQLSGEVYLSPYEAKWKVFIIHDAERMLAYSANALLKTFEEPSRDSVIILLSSAPERLLPTILSRCRIIHFHMLTEEQIAAIIQQKGKNLEEAKRIAGLSRGSAGNAFRLMEGNGFHSREIILGLLAKGKLPDYAQLTKMAGEISEKIEDSIKPIEEAARTGLAKGLPDDMTAVQKQSLEKEIDGIVSLRLSAEAHELFDIILSWYRDLHVMQFKGAEKLLIHRDYKNEMEQALQRGEALPIEEVQKHIAEAKLALERSTSLNMCLERLFLQLNLL